MTVIAQKRTPQYQYLQKYWAVVLGYPEFIITEPLASMYIQYVLPLQ